MGPTTNHNMGPGQFRGWLTDILLSDSPEHLHADHRWSDEEETYVLEIYFKTVVGMVVAIHHLLDSARSGVDVLTFGNTWIEE
jgi:hypothetical protein